MESSLSDGYEASGEGSRTSSHFNDGAEISQREIDEFLHESNGLSIESIVTSPNFTTLEELRDLSKYEFPDFDFSNFTNEGPEADVGVPSLLNDVNQSSILTLRRVHDEIKYPARTNEMTVEIIQDYVARTDEELAVAAGDELTLLLKKPFFYCLKKANQKGFVPTRCIKIVDSDEDGELSEVIVRYTSKSRKELSVEQGDKVRILSEKFPEWYYVRIRDEEGAIPRYCVHGLNFPEPGFRQVVAICDYKKTSDEELSFRKGDVFSLISKNRNENHWFLVKVIVKEGYVPRACLEKANPQDADNKTLVATRDYAKASLKELSLREGELYTLLHQTNEDWWFVEVKWKQGYVSARCIQLFDDGKL